LFLIISGLFALLLLLLLLSLSLSSSWIKDKSTAFCQTKAAGSTNRFQFLTEFRRFLFVITNNVSAALTVSQLMWNGEFSQRVKSALIWWPLPFTSLCCWDQEPVKLYLHFLYAFMRWYVGTSTTLCQQVYGINYLTTIEHTVNTSLLP
jgi:hypothetical protein